MIITTDSDGSLYTTTSAFDTKDGSQTDYTTTIHTTDPNGDVLTKTVVVCETTDSDGSLTTTTSVCPERTTYVSTKEDGSETTVSADLIETTIDGVTTIYTSVCPEQTTFVSTKEDGSEATFTGDIIETTIDGTPTSFTSVHSAPTVKSTFTTQYETTREDGHVETTLDVVVVGTGSDGVPYTSTIAGESVAPGVAPTGTEAGGDTPADQTTFDTVYTSTGSAAPPNVSSYEAGASSSKFSAKWLLPFAFFAMF